MGRRIAIGAGVMYALACLATIPLVVRRPLEQTLLGLPTSAVELDGVRIDVPRAWRRENELLVDPYLGIELSIEHEHDTIHILSPQASDPRVRPLLERISAARTPFSRSKMPISSKAVERVVEDISSGASDPKHVATVVGELMRGQPAIGHYVQGHAKELTIEGTVVVLLHAAVLVRCVEQSRRQMLRRLDFRALDLAASQPGALEIEPALASYVDSNLTPDDPLLGGMRRAVARAILATIARAALADSR